MAGRIEDSLKYCSWLDLAISALKANELEVVNSKTLDVSSMLKLRLPFS